MFKIKTCDPDSIGIQHTQRLGKKIISKQNHKSDLEFLEGDQNYCRGVAVASTKKLGKIRERRARRVRTKIHGTQVRPRLSVFRSSRYIYVQAIADDTGETLAQASALNEELKGNPGGLKKTEMAREVGKLLAKNLLSKNIKEAVFDRGRFLYHGRVKSLAEGIREMGVKL